MSVSEWGRYRKGRYYRGRNGERYREKIESVVEEETERGIEKGIVGGIVGHCMAGGRVRGPGVVTGTRIHREKSRQPPILSFCFLTLERNVNTRSK